MLAKLFKFKENGTDLRTEIIAGLTTFTTMAYILFVNPMILSAAGVPVASTVAATCIGAAIPTIAMGLFTNYPIALAAGMGMNSAVVSLIFTKHLSWQVGMGVIVLEGLLITLLVVAGLREAVLRSIPMNLKRAIGAAIGLMIAFIGMRSASWVVSSKTSIITFGDFTTKIPLIAAAGVVITAALMARKVRGGLLLGIIATTIIAFISGEAKAPASIVEFPSFATFAHADIVHALSLGLLATVFSFMMIDFFDTMGTVIGLGEQAGYVDEKGNLPRVSRVLLIDSLAAAWGGICCGSSSTSYIESSAGISEGGRTGFTSVVVGTLFLLALFFSPIAGMVPAAATAPALIVVGFLMVSVVKEIDFGNIEEAFPAFLILLIVPLTFSISHGIGCGF